jgi:hypothetical protein
MESEMSTAMEQSPLEPDYRSCNSKWIQIYKLKILLITDEPQTALFKDPVRTAL